jgi:hypothetical protein
MGEKQIEISVAEKQALVQNNLRVLRQQEYDLAINIQVNKIAEDEKEIERLKGLLAKVLKKIEGFEQILAALTTPAPQ